VLLRCRKKTNLFITCPQSSSCRKKLAFLSAAVVLGPSLDEYQRTCELMMTSDENEDPEHIYKYKYTIRWQSGIVFRNW
jgi:hypothetical protein